MSPTDDLDEVATAIVFAGHCENQGILTPTSGCACSCSARTTRVSGRRHSWILAVMEDGERPTTVTGRANW